jgi:hypothetical protein
MDQGHHPNDLLPILQSAAVKIENAVMLPQQNKLNAAENDSLFIHWRFHPIDINKNKISEAYNITLNWVIDNFKQMRIVISRPKNLRYVLCRTDLHLLEEKKVSDIIQKLTRSDPNS